MSCDWNTPQYSYQYIKYAVQFYKIDKRTNAPDEKTITKLYYSDIALNYSNETRHYLDSICLNNCSIYHKNDNDTLVLIHIYNRDFYMEKGMEDFQNNDSVNLFFTNYYYNEAYIYELEICSEYKPHGFFN